jgi:D-alanyl-D-alanine carboxypeptidase
MYMPKKLFILAAIVLAMIVVDRSTGARRVLLDVSDTVAGNIRSIANIASTEVSDARFVIASASPAVPEQLTTSGTTDGTTAMSLDELLRLTSSSAEMQPAPAPASMPTAIQSSEAVITEPMLQNSAAAGSRAFRQVKQTSPPELTANAALVADLGTGERYLDIGSDRRWPTASLTKLLTAAVARERLSATTTVTVTADDVAPDSVPTAPITVGSAYSARDTIRAMLLLSSNELAEALAGTYGRDRFVAELNDRARAWNMNDTHFDDASGLSIANQSSASDLLLLARKMYSDYSDILTITRQSQGTVTELTTKKRQNIQNINRFAGTTGFIGGKTGYTDAANGNLLSLFSVAGRPVAIIVLGTDDRFGETAALLAWFKDSYALAR